MKPLALIPAKGTSERLSRKNLRLLAGKPLLYWSIEAARASELFDDRIYVTSEDPEVLQVAAAAGAQPLKRPEILSTQEATVDDVIKWAWHTLEWGGAMVVMLPTSPFRAPATLRNAWQTFEARCPRVLMSLTPTDHPPFWAILWEGDTIAPMLQAYFHLPRHQLPRTYRHDGAYLIVTQGGTGITVFQAPQLETLDINTQQDLDFAEFLVKTGRISWISAPKSAILEA